MRLRPQRAGLVVLALAAVLGGAAYAAIPDPSGLIHGCYDNQSGKLRVFDADGEIRHELEEVLSRIISR